MRRLILKNNKSLFPNLVIDPLCSNAFIDGWEHAVQHGTGWAVSHAPFFYILTDDKNARLIGAEDMQRANGYGHFQQYIGRKVINGRSYNYYIHDFAWSLDGFKLSKTPLNAWDA